MADEQTIEQFLDRLDEVNAKFSISSKELTSFASELRKGNKSVADAAKKTAKTHEDAADQFSTASKDVVASLKQQAIASWNAASAEKDSSLKQVRFQEAVSDSARYLNEEFKTTIAVTSEVTTAVGSFTMSLQKGASANSVMSAMLTSGAGIAGLGMNTLGSVLKAGGSAMLVASPVPHLKVLGAAAAGAGMVLESFSGTATKFAKFTIQVFAAELEKTIASFETLSASGAMFTGGLTDMRNAANDSFLTLTQFSAVIKRNSKDLTAAGGGVIGGIKILSAVSREFDADSGRMRKSMLKLGYTYEQQTELIAETMSDMRASGMGMLSASGPEIALQTAKYAENLRIISSVTGEDAKAKMAQVRDQASQLAFQQKLAGMEEGQRQNTINAMVNMSALERKNFMDMVNFGVIINKEGAAATAMSSNLANAQRETYALHLQGQLDGESQRDVAKRNSAGIQKDLLGNVALGLAGAAGVGGIVQAISEVLGNELQERKRLTAGALTEAEIAANKQKNTTDALTNNYVEVVKDVQRMTVDLETALSTGLKHYTSAMETMADLARRAMVKAGVASDATKNEVTQSNIKSLEERLDKALNKKNIFGQKIPESSNISAMLIRQRLDKANASLVAANNTSPSAQAGAVSGGFATGGISSGATSGYQATLHGTEAVVPLPDNRSIPVDLNTGGMEHALNEQTATLKEMHFQMEKTNRNLDKIYQASM